MHFPNLLCQILAMVSLALLCGCSRETTKEATRRQDKQRPIPVDHPQTDPSGKASLSATGNENVERGQQPMPDIPRAQEELPEAGVSEAGNPAGMGYGKLQEDTMTALESGNLTEAFELVRELERVDGENPQTIFLMARVLAEKHRFRQAVKMLDDLAVDFPDAKLAVLGQTAEWLVFQGDWTAAEERYRTLLTLVDETSLIDRLLSRLLIRQGRQVEARVLLQRLCKAGNVEEMDLRSLLSLSWPLPGDAATEAFEPIGLQGIVRNAISLGEIDPAIEMLLQAEDENSAAFGAAEFGLLGRLLVLTGQHDRIAGWVDRAPEGVEQYSDYWFALGKSQLEQKNFPEAVNSLCRAVLLDETDHRAYRMLAAALKAIGNHEQAEDAVERADWIQQTVKLGDQMASSPQRDVRQIGVLIELLEKLRRPLEALGWRGIQVAYGRANSMLDESSAKNVLQMINQKRVAELQKKDADARRSFITCGVDLPLRSN